MQDRNLRFLIWAALDDRCPRLARAEYNTRFAAIQVYFRIVRPAADELDRDAAISDRTWAELEARYDTKQLMDVVFTVGEYNLVSMALKSFRVQLDEGVEGFPQ